MGTRVYKVAKEYGLSSKDIIKICQKQGIDVKSHMNMLTENQIKLIKSDLIRLSEKSKKKENQDLLKKEEKKEKVEKVEKGRSQVAEIEKKEKKEEIRKKDIQIEKKEKKKKVSQDVPKKPKKIIIDFTESIDFIQPQYAKEEIRPRKKRKKAKDIEEIEKKVLEIQEEKEKKEKEEEPSEPQVVEITLPITIRSLSAAIGIKANEIIKFLMSQGSFYNVNESLPEDIAMLVALEYNKELKIKKERDIEEDLEELGEGEYGGKDIRPRPPVVTFMGHVDHGKTSLLDAIRKTNVVATESGGITQHIGAYQVNTSHGIVTFLDTPGHEAFTEMRSRGAVVTDIVVLVVAADDGVMPQTKEAVSHAKAANVPIMVAINKIDKPNANVPAVKQQLSGLGLHPEEWGGDTICVEVSAVTGQGVSDLVEMIALQGEMMELKARWDGPARGVVLESQVSEGRGILATVLVQEGVLKKGDIVLCSHGYGRVRVMHDDKGNEVTEAPPSTPVEIAGLSQVPMSGDKFYVLDDLQKAKQIAESRNIKLREAALANRTHVSLQNIFSKIEEGSVKELKVILKADVQGSLEALTKYINEISTDEVKINIIHQALGGINESDVLLADASDAVIIGFHVVPDTKAKILAESRGVDIRIYHVIFHLRDDLKKAMKGLLEPEQREEVTARLEVREIFKISRIGTIAGCYVVKGTVQRSNKVRVIRDNVVIYDGKIDSLKRFKDDVREVSEGFECGLHIEKYDDIKPGDILETYKVVKVEREL